MATVAHLGATADTSNAQVYTSGSFSPTVGDLLVVMVQNTASVDTTATLTESIGSCTYSLIGFQSWTGTTHGMHAFVSDQLVTSSTARTWTYTLPADPATGVVFGIERITGMTRAGTNAVRQVTPNAAGNKGASGTPVCTFSAACLTGNPTVVMACVVTNPPAVTPPTSWTELVDTGYASPVSGLETAGRDSGFTGTAVTWGSSVAVTWGAHGVELDATAATSTPPGILVAARR